MTARRAIRSPKQYLAAVRNSREVYYRGERVDDVTAHPQLRIAARHGALDFELAQEPAYADLAVTDSYSTSYALSRTAADLRRRPALIEASTAHGGTLVVLLKEIGTDALFALHRVIHGSEGYERVERYFTLARERDLALAVAQTDAKGDRSQGPSGQADPDLYLRVVAWTNDGVVVRGAKVHTSCTPNVDEVIVIPTRALGEGEEDWAVAFALPVATPGLKLFCSDYLHGADDAWTHPISSRHPRARAYVARRRAEGRTHRDASRARDASIQAVPAPD